MEWSVPATVEWKENDLDCRRAPRGDGKRFVVHADECWRRLLNWNQRFVARLKSTIEKQDATNARQQKQIEALTSGLQKVNARFEMNRPAQQVAESDH
jgi:hypothetical protein